MVFSFNTRYPLSSYVFKASKEKKHLLITLFFLLEIFIEK